MTRWLRSLLAAALLAGAALVVLAPSASACSCAGPMTVAGSLERAETAFSGRVTDIDRPLTTNGALTINFSVDRVYKGTVARDTIVHTAAQSASCGISVAQGRDYVVFATGSGAVVEAGLCGGTFEGRPTAELGEGREPEPARSFHRPPVGALITVIAALAAGGVIGSRLRRRRRPRQR